METCFRHYRRKAQDRKGYRYTDNEGWPQAQGAKYVVECIVRKTEKEKTQKEALVWRRSQKQA